MYEDQVAAVYDLFAPPDRTAEAERWAGLAGAGATHLLECMVGTAEVAFLLAARGFHVWGVDISRAMLAVAERRRESVSAEAASRVTLVEADIACAELPRGRFDLAYVANGSWNLLTDAETRSRALQVMRASLRPGGLLALELFPPLTSTGRSEPRSYAPFRPAPAGLNVSKTSIVSRDEGTQFMTIDETLEVNGRKHSSALTLRMLRPGEVKRELEAAGFEDASVDEAASAAPWAMLAQGRASG